MLPGFRTPLGRLNVSSAAPSANAKAAGGILVEPDGDICIAAVAPTRFSNGFGVTNLGQLCVATGGAIAGYSGGLPMTADGRLVTLLNVAPDATDPYVGGVRVGAAGVHMTDSFVVITAGFSNGFSGGFNAA